MRKSLLTLTLTLTFSTLARTAGQRVGISTQIVKALLDSLGIEFEVTRAAASAAASVAYRAIWSPSSSTAWCPRTT